MSGAPSGNGASAMGMPLSLATVTEMSANSTFPEGPNIAGLRSRVAAPWGILKTRSWKTHSLVPVAWKTLGHGFMCFPAAS